ncbi:branched-chain amino acid ABC transporter permease [Chloroflexota bacterium]
MELGYAATSYLQYVAIFILLSWSVYLTFRVGQLYNGGIFTMLCGAYFSAYATKDWGWPFGLALLVAALFGALLAFIPGLALAKAPAFTTAIATIAMVFIGTTVIRNIQFLGGVSGYWGIPRIPYLLPVSYLAVFIIGFLIYRLDNSRLGRAMESISADPNLASTLGVNNYRMRLMAQMLAGGLGGVAGTLYAFHLHALKVQQFSFNLLLYVFCFVFVGGWSTMWGAVVFTPILWAVTVFLPPEIQVLKDWIYGILLIVILIARPDGIIDKQAVRSIKERFSSLRRNKLASSA